MVSFDADNLTDSELRTKLAEYGHPVGPVTETTRKILIKKLKILMKQENAKKNSLKNILNFSSGDESGSDTDQNGGNRNLRRISMPPPSGYKSTKRKSSSRNYSLLDASPVPSISKVSCSTPLTPSRSNTDSRVSRFGSSFSIEQPQSTAIIRPTVFSTSSYDFESGSDSDYSDFKCLPLPSSKKRTGLPYGSFSSYRSKLSNANTRNLFTSSLDSSPNRSKNKKESRPFLSNFVGRFSKKSGLNDNLNPLNIKESDVEEDMFNVVGSDDKWRNVHIATRSFNFRDWAKPFKSAVQHLKSKDSTFSSCYKSWNSSQLLSMLLLGLFILFFVWLALAYFRVSNRTGIGGKSGHNYPLCTESHDQMPCIVKENLPYAIRLYKDIHIELQARGLRALCGSLDDGLNEKAYMTEDEVKRFLLQSRNDELAKVLNGINNLKILILANKHWGISLLSSSEGIDDVISSHLPDKSPFPNEITSYASADNNCVFIGRSISIPWTCFLSRLLYQVMFTVARISCVVGGGFACYMIWKMYYKTKKEENQQVMAMVEEILEYMAEVAEKANSGVDSNGSATSLPQGYVAVRHVHDTLIHPTERQKMAGIWEKAVKFIDEHESRIRTEVQQIWGEEAAVWRWLGPTLNKTPVALQVSSDSGKDMSGSNHLYPDLSSLKAEKGSDRVWQGEAFETSEGSMNSLPSSPTQCLKIRHMFKHDKDYGADWVVKIKDAIVEKCEGAKIVHLSVDKDSKEGCVYVKCASPKDAGIAYRQLHGSWFDGALVTVKYLRLERYHERFPDSALARTALQPSNNLRLSLQRTSAQQRLFK